MVRISRVNKQLIPLATPTLVAANILERLDLHEESLASVGSVFI
jgi:hypothetical protein